jgi:16S rRNA (guanine966-N2)-methyltransferase
MRIIAGSLGGRTFASPGSAQTHPMSQKARGALFNALGDISGLSVLDAFAGSGGLSFEAVSRGAAGVVAIDSDRLAQKTIEQNSATLDIAGEVKLVKASVNTWLATNPKAQFDIVLCDPPYDNLQPNLLIQIADHVKPGGLIIFSLPPTADFSLDTNYQLLTTKSYGDARLAFYRRIS